MRQPLGLSDEDKSSYGLSTFSIQSFACFIVVIFIGFLLRLSTVVWGTASRCVEADQFWFEPYAKTWPLGGTFFLILFLVLVWNTSIAVNLYVRRRRGLLLTSVNFAGVIGLLLVAGPALDTAQIRYDYRENSFGVWRVENRKRSLWAEDECVLARPYVGRWKVVETDLPKYGLEFPVRWIELKGTLELAVSDSRWEDTTEGWWSPPRPARRWNGDNMGAGELIWDRGWSVWVFDLEGDQLTLTTPDWIDWQEPGKVVLRRME